MGGESEREQCGGGPAEQLGDWMREQGSDPTEVSFYVPGSVELSIPLCGQCAGEKDSEEKKDDPAYLARERRLRRPIVPVPARAW